MSPAKVDSTKKANPKVNAAKAAYTEMIQTAGSLEEQLKSYESNFGPKIPPAVEGNYVRQATLPLFREGMFTDKTKLLIRLDMDRDSFTPLNKTKIKNLLRRVHVKIPGPNIRLFDFENIQYAELHFRSPKDRKKAQQVHGRMIEKNIIFLCNVRSRYLICFQVSGFPVYPIGCSTYVKEILKECFKNRSVEIQKIILPDDGINLIGFAFITVKPHHPDDPNLYANITARKYKFEDPECNKVKLTVEHVHPSLELEELFESAELI